MTEEDYDIGYGKPPKAYQYQKGQQGHRPGRKKKVESTWAKIIEEAWMERIPLSDAGITPFEIIVIQLQAKMANGIRKAHRVFRKYEAFANTKPALKQYLYKEYEAGDYGAYLRGDPNWKKAKPNAQPDTPQAQAARARAIKIARMKAGLEPIEISPDMTAREAVEMYGLFLEQERNSPPQRPRERRRRKIKLAASEIFDRAINSPVKLHDKGKTLTVPRMVGVLRSLLAKAMNGNISCSDLLIDIHAYSLKHGDFYPETTRVPK